MAKAKGSSDPSTPLSWNRYAYVLGDPVNQRDRHGLYLDCDDDGSGCCDDESDDGCDDQPPTGGGGGGGRKKKKSGNPSPYPQCNPNGSPSTDQQINFILTNYSAAAAVASEADQDLSGLNAQNFNAATVLGWAAAESGWAPPGQSKDSGLASGNLDFFNVKTGPLWIDTVGCSPAADTYWACYGSFQSAAESVLFSATQYGSYNSISGVSAGYVLGQQLGGGASIATAFDAMSIAVHFAQVPGYGSGPQGVQSTVNSVSGLLNCLKSNYAGSF